MNTMKDAAYSVSRIVCAAVRYSDGAIIAGARHFDSVMRGAVIERGFTSERPEQGFIDQHGQFYNRREAWMLAEANGQIIRRCGGDGPEGAGLFSENLY